MAIGERIRLVRKQKSMTQKKLAGKLGVSYVVISQYESSKRNPKIGTLERIAAALGCTADYLEGKVALPTQHLTFISEAEHGKLMQYELLKAERDKHKAFYDMISKLNNCNNCSLKKICCVRPGLGECVRYNCAMWRGLENRHGQD